MPNHEIKDNGFSYIETDLDVNDELKPSDNLQQPNTYQIVDNLDTDFNDFEENNFSNYKISENSNNQKSQANSLIQPVL